ncbi:hypothetical protein [Ectothiorhodospira sp. BSL-9]|uniref:hypothetical protein n=1 Tax=Ectothiorhodospira sp. BSL-9 TaxID=1442136 RepID=UPI0012E7D59A|nr:hypothetical protein [Ectothiorhodospira sp. BSL-9]
MSNVRQRLVSMRRHLDALQSAAGEADAHVRDLVAQLSGELAGLEQALDPRQSESSPGHAVTREPDGDAEKCPCCTLRSLYAVPGEVRDSQDRDGGREALFHCWSCGYDTWRPI